jgi:hypothetical protein
LRRGLGLAATTWLDYSPPRAPTGFKSLNSKPR